MDDRRGPSNAPADRERVLAFVVTAPGNGCGPLGRTSARTSGMGRLLECLGSTRNRPCCSVKEGYMGGLPRPVNTQ